MCAGGRDGGPGTVGGRRDGVVERGAALALVLRELVDFDDEFGGLADVTVGFAAGHGDLGPGDGLDDGRGLRGKALGVAVGDLVGVGVPRGRRKGLSHCRFFLASA